jgi:XTP/dITP diphosphohydrolase
MRAILSEALPQVQVLSVADLAEEKRAAYSAEETGTTYAANALIKARALAPLVDGWILSEDSGFEVEAMGNEPGVYSARFASDDKARCAKILAALRGMPPEKRRAKFVACMVLLDPAGDPAFFFGRKDGYVAEQARGTKGFGYDPIFCPVLGGPTWGETDVAEKVSDSHRGKALASVIQYMIVRGSL